MMAAFPGLCVCAMLCAMSLGWQGTGQNDTNFLKHFLAHSVTASCAHGPLQVTPLNDSQQIVLGLHAG